MYSKYRTKPNKTGLARNTSFEGESIEQKVSRIVNNKEPIKDGAPLIWTDRKDGVIAAFNIKTDRMELALDQKERQAKAHLAKREEGILKRTMGEEAYNNMKKEQGKNETGGQSTQATTGQG